MKNLLLVLSSLLASTNIVLACPNLSGRFYCKAQNGSTQDLTFATRVENEVQIYTINSTELIANGEPISKPKTDGRPAIYTASCEGQTLHVEMTTSVKSGLCPKSEMQVESVTNFHLNESGITQDDLTVLLCPEKAPLRFKLNYVCTKAPTQQ